MTFEEMLKTFGFKDEAELRTKGQALAMSLSNTGHEDLFDLVSLLIMKAFPEVVDQANALMLKPEEVQ